MGKWRQLGKDTEKILSMSSALTNRQVADLLGYEIGKVKETRRRHGVVYNKIPKDQGIADKIKAFDLSVPSLKVSEELGCCVQWVNYVRKQMKKET